MDHGIGKSVVAAEIFVQMKLMNLKVELCTEYAKDLVYENRNETIKDQIYIFGKMQHKLNTLQRTVDYAIVDSPLLLNLVYKDRTQDMDHISSSAFKEMIIQVYHQFNNINICLCRDNDNNFYQQYGRIQNLNESIGIDGEIKQYLENCNLPYYSVYNKNGCFKKTVDQIMNILTKTILK